MKLREAKRGPEHGFYIASLAVPCAGRLGSLVLSVSEWMNSYKLYKPIGFQPEAVCKVPDFASRQYKQKPKDDDSMLYLIIDVHAATWS